MLRVFIDDKNQVDLEIEILNYLKKRGQNKYIIEIHEEFEFRYHSCMGMEILSQNLYDLIKETKFNGLKIEAIRRISIQMLYALRSLK